MQPGVRGLSSFYCVLMTLFVMSAPALAQGNPGVAISNEFEAKASERARRKAGPLNMPEFNGASQGSSKAPLFRLKAVDVVGIHSLPRGEIAAAYRPYLGREVSQADLARIADAITAQYKAAGYALSRAFVPPQDIEDGRVTVRVAEGYVADVAIEGLGSDWFIARQLLEPITQDRPTRLRTLERQMLLLSDLPGIRIKDAALKELGTGSGRFKLTITAEFVRAIASIDIDNRGSHQIGPWQNFNTVALNSVLRRGDTLIVNGATALNDPRQLGYVGTIYEMPLGADGARLGLRQTFSEGWPAGWQRSFDVRTRTQDYALYASVQPLRSREASIKLTAGGGLRAVEEVSSLGQSYEDHVSALFAAIDLQRQDAWGGNNLLTLTGRQGVTAFGASGSQDLTTSRYGAASDFSKLSMIAVRYQALAGPFSLMLASTAQATSGPVVRSEAFGFGGSFIGRAFAPAALIGDSGMAGLVELRFDQKLEARPLRAYQLYAFADRGVLWTRNGETQAAGSWGGGARFALDRDVRLGFEVATVLDAPAYLERETRFLVSVGVLLNGCATFACE